MEAGRGFEDPSEGIWGGVEGRGGGCHDTGAVAQMMVENGGQRVSPVRRRREM